MVGWSVGRSVGELLRSTPLSFFKTALFQDTRRKLTPRVAKNFFKKGILSRLETTRKKQVRISRARTSEYTIFGWTTSNRIESIIFTVQRIFASGREQHEGGEKKEIKRRRKKKGGRTTAIRRVADPPTNLNPLRSNLAVVGRESGRVNIGAVSFNEPCAPLLFRKRARRRSFGRKRFASAAAAAAAPRNGAKFMRPTGLKPIECLSARFGLNGTRLLPDIRKYRPTVSRLIRTVLVDTNTG